MEINSEPVPEILQADEICIVNHDTTREFYKNTLKEWLRIEGVRYQVMSSDSENDVCEWVLRYYGRWSWEIVPYLADTYIDIYRDGAEAGHVSFRVGHTVPNKWEDSAERIFKLMDMLVGKRKVYQTSKQGSVKK